MQKPKTKSYAIVVFALDNLVESVTLSAGGAQAFVLDGALIVGGVLPAQELGYIVGYDSNGDDTGITFTTVGTDPDGNATSEVVTGGSSVIAVGTVFFRTISSITASGDTASTITIGTVATTLVAQSPTYVLDIYQPHTSIAVNISGTIDYSILKTFQRATQGDTLNFQAGGLADQTADGNTSYTSPTGGVRFQLNDYSAGATASVTFAQSRLT